jgi:L-iditol 2-dehydrogenase
MQALSGGILNLDKLITHTYPLEDAISAMEICSNIAMGSLKIQIVDDLEIILRRGGIVRQTKL